MKEYKNNNSTSIKILKIMTADKNNYKQYSDFLIKTKLCKINLYEDFLIIRMCLSHAFK